jgi:hypothetical protein
LKFKQRAYADWDIVEAESIPPDVRAWFDAATPSLLAKGFAPFLTVRQTEMVKGVRLYSSWWSNIDCGQCASCTVVISAMGKVQRFVGFETVCIDPLTTVSTSNEPNAGVFDRVPRLHKQRYPWIQDVSQLYQIHLYSERRVIAANATRCIPSSDPQRVIEEQKNAGAFVMREQARLGLFFETEEVGAFRLTWYGAYLTVMRLLPPGRQLRTWKSNRGARRVALLAASEKLGAPRGVAVTDVSPFEPPLSIDQLSYA